MKTSSEVPLSFKLTAEETDRLSLSMSLTIQLMQDMANNKPISEVLKHLQLIKQFAGNRHQLQSALNKMIKQIAHYDYGVINPTNLRMQYLSADNFKVISKRENMYSIFDALEEITLKQAEAKLKTEVPLTPEIIEKSFNDVFDSIMPEPSTKLLIDKLVNITDLFINNLNSEEEMNPLMERFLELFDNAKLAYATTEIENEYAELYDSPETDNELSPVHETVDNLVAEFNNDEEIPVILQDTATDEVNELLNNID